MTFLIPNAQQATVEISTVNNPGGIVVFSFLTSQQKGKRNNKLCELCASVVKKIRPLTSGPLTINFEPFSFTLGP